MKGRSISILVSLIIIFVGIAMVVTGAILGATAGGIYLYDTESFTKEYTDVIDSISIDHGVGELNVVKGDTFKIVARNIRKDSVRCEVENGKLSIKTHRSHWDILGWNFYPFNHDSYITVYVPENIELKDFYIATGVGEANISDIKADKIKIETDVGSSQFDNIKAKKISIDGGVGKISIRNSDLANLDLSTDVGGVDISGKLDGDCNIRGGVGKISLDCQADTDDYDFDISKGVGDVKINGDSYSHYKNKSAKYTMKINNGVGKVNINLD